MNSPKAVLNEVQIILKLIDPHYTIKFPSAEVELLGRMLSTSDILAQMANRTYLEKLLFLYHEFKEANFGGYEGEVDLLRKTIDFYKS